MFARKKLLKALMIVVGMGMNTQIGAKSAIRAAFDLGSGKFKMLVARVDTDAHRVEEALCSDIIEVRLGDDYAQNKGVLSEAAQQRALEALLSLKAKALEHGATEYSAIATAIFRKAQGGPALLEKLSKITSIPAKVISQRQEGIIGFYTMLAAHEVAPEGAISWDSGNASFQIVTADGDKYTIYEGPWGNALVVSAFVEKIRQAPFTMSYSVNPLSVEEIYKLIALIQSELEVPAWLCKATADPTTHVRSIGDGACIFAVTARAVGKPTYTQDEVRAALLALAGHASDDSLFKELNPTDPKVVVTHVALVYAVMSACGIRQVSFKETVGSNLGLLLAPAFWQTSKPALAHNTVEIVL